MTSTTPADDFDILDWIESGTVAQRSVVIYNDPALAIEFDDLDRRLKAAQSAKKAGADESSVGERDGVAEIHAAMEDLWRRWEASKSTWVVQALPPETIDGILSAHPNPPRPDLPKGMAETLRAKRYEEWSTATNVAAAERKLAYVAAGVIRIETPKGVAYSITVPALRTMRDRPHGPARIDQLYKAVEEATAGDVEIPAPNSLSSSEGTQD